MERYQWIEPMVEHRLGWQWLLLSGQSEQWRVCRCKRSLNRQWSGGHSVAFYWRQQPAMELRGCLVVEEEHRFLSMLLFGLISMIYPIGIVAYLINPTAFGNVNSPNDGLINRIVLLLGPLAWYVISATLCQIKTLDRAKQPSRDQ